MILHEIVKAINNLNEKVDAIGQAMGPVQDVLEHRLASCTFDKDIISSLLETSKTDLNNLEASAYATYVDGMTALGVKRGVQEAIDFKVELDRLQKTVPDTLIENIKNGYAKVTAWQSTVQQASIDINTKFAEIERRTDELRALYANNEGEIRKATREAKEDMKKQQAEVEKEIHSAIEAVRDSSKEFIDRVHQEAIETMPDAISEEIKKRYGEVEDWKRQVDEELSKVKKGQSDLSGYADRFVTFSEQYEHRIKGAAKLASMQMEKSYMEVRGEVEESINKMRNSTREMVESIHRQAHQTIQESKVDMSAQLDRAVSDVRKSVSDMESKKELLVDLAQKAGQNIIETGRTIARNSNSLPRSQRGRRNN